MKLTANTLTIQIIVRLAGSRAVRLGQLTVTEAVDRKQHTNKGKQTITNSKDNQKR
jgi:hypothetical protein